MVESASDLFDDYTDAGLDRIFAGMALCPQHRFFLATKRAERMQDYATKQDIRTEINRAATAIALANGLGDELRVEAYERIRDWPLPNVHLGVIVRDQAEADALIPILLQTPAAKRWVDYVALVAEVSQTRTHTRLRCLKVGRFGWLGWGSQQ